MGETPPALSDPVSGLEGIGPKRAGLLANLGIQTIKDLILHLPRTHEDRGNITAIATAVEGEIVTIEAEVVRARSIRLRGRMTMAALVLKDETGEISATFFGQGFLARSVFRPGVRGFFTGKVEQYNGLALKNPEYELLSGDEEDRLNSGRIVPVYPLTEGISQRMLRRWIAGSIDATVASLEETLPEALVASHGFPSLRQAVRTVHFPKDLAEVRLARDRLAYEELLGIQLSVLRARAARLHEETGIRHTIDGPYLKGLREALPFTLSAAQGRVVGEILEDMSGPRPMARLLQGDVGCGKTIVALHAVAAAADGGYQTALMAPTEILAEQHYIQLKVLLEPRGLTPVLLTGSTRRPAAVRRSIAAGEAAIVVGTHAMIQDSTAFHRLGLVIVDEQHRFGVMQRERLRAKGSNPDVLHMTATPIPRTIALTVYGSMDLSIIDELPPGRLPVNTARIPPAKVAGLYEYLRREAEAGRQAYIVCPLIEESETRESTALFTHYEEMTSGALAGLRTELLHGRLDAGEKEAIMLRFKAGAIDALFSTTVIEVGVDVSTATIMIIEDAGSFGLTQLHQLRGRVGRGPDPSHCFLLGKPATADGKKRLELLCKYHSGFDIAEEDLKLRGPGELYGMRQAGLSDLRIADLVRDVRLLDAARRDAVALLSGAAPIEDKNRAQLIERLARGAALGT